MVNYCKRPSVQGAALTLADAILSGGLGYGKICVPTGLTDLLLIILYPPAYVFLFQKRNGFNDIKSIIISFLLTSFFYFPGLIHALLLKSKLCGGLMGNEDNK